MKPIIYQLVVRYFGNTNLTNQVNGPLLTNGCGKFNDIDANALNALRELGITHIWLTGVLRQATLTDYSEDGMPADDPDIVKGLAGSFYAVRDYYDVCPDYATAPGSRMQEFDALLTRIHGAGLMALIDLVPNHVSRGYNSTTKPETTFGAGDDLTQFFSSQNNFFYLVDYPNQPLRLTRPGSWNPTGVVFDGRFALEDGSAAHPVKVTGNNVYKPTPSESDWYETVKLNYGFNFRTGESTYNPQPRTWGAVDAILAYWQTKGVDGFRCDFAHYVPAEAWSYLIANARQRRPAYFFGEAYPSGDQHDPVQNLQQLIDAGFDAVYHYQAYNALKGIYLYGAIDGFDQELVSQSPEMRAHLVSYLENHDERRVASAIVVDGQTGDSGFGSAEAGYQLAPLQFLYGSGPAMLLNGQEVGEPAAGQEGFGGDDGRTTFYDYWTMPEFAKWVNGGRYDGAGLSAAQAALRKFYRDLNALCQNASVQGDGFWGLWYFNNPGRFGDCPANLFSYARFRSGSGRALLVAANFRAGGSINGSLRIPRELSAAVGFGANIEVKMVLTRSGAVDQPVGAFGVGALASNGFGVSIGNQTAQVYLLNTV